MLRPDAPPAASSDNTQEEFMKRHHVWPAALALAASLQAGQAQQAPDTILYNGKVLTVKAMTIHEDVEVSPEVKKAIPALSELAGQIGDRSVRHRGTIGGSIAHGFLTLSMLSAMAYDALPEVEGRTMGMNYGFDKIRFLSPVPAGSKVRAHFVISQVEKKSPQQVVVRYAVSVEIEGKPKPALAAEWLTVAFFG